jgi:hypothetical protein
MQPVVVSALRLSRIRQTNPWKYAHLVEMRILTLAQSAVSELKRTTLGEGLGCLSVFVIVAEIGCLDGHHASETRSRGMYFGNDREWPVSHFIVDAAQVFA